MLLFILGLRGEIDDGKWEGICDFEGAIDIHADEGASGGGGESAGAVFDDLHDNEGLELHRLERRLLSATLLVLVVDEVVRHTQGETWWKVGWWDRFLWVLLCSELF